MRAAIVVCLALIACGKKTESSHESGSATTAPKPSSDRFAKKKQPKVSPVCEKARISFGYGAECIETELPELTSPAGKLTRVSRKGDPTGMWMYVLTKPDGSMFVGDGGTNGSILDEVLKGFDAKTAAPELLAKLQAALDREVAIVRCLPGSNDKLPQKDGKDIECKPPAITKTGDKVVLSYISEEFPHPRLMNRTEHWISAPKIDVRDHEMSAQGGDVLVELPKDVPLPKDMPPPPTMATPPEWVAKPVAAPDDVSKALCAVAVEKLSDMAGRQCKAFAYPSLDSPAGSLFYLATDSALRQVLALKKPDGAIVVGFDIEATENPLIAIVKNYDPKTMPAEKIVAMYLFLHGEAARILCLPGSNDVIPETRCDPPKAVKKGDELVLTYTVEELSFPNNHGSVPDPAVRSYTTELTPGGGSSGGGSREVDMRDQAE